MKLSLEYGMNTAHIWFKYIFFFLKPVITITKTCQTDEFYVSKEIIKLLQKIRLFVQQLI